MVTLTLLLAQRLLTPSAVGDLLVVGVSCLRLCLDVIDAVSACRRHVAFILRLRFAAHDDPSPPKVPQLPQALALVVLGRTSSDDDSNTISDEPLPEVLDKKYWPSDGTAETTEAESDEFERGVSALLVDLTFAETRSMPRSTVENNSCGGTFTKNSSIEKILEAKLTKQKSVSAESALAGANNDDDPIPSHIVGDGNILL